LLSKEWWLLTFRWLFWKKSTGNKAGLSPHLTGASLWIALLSCALGVGSLSFVRALVTGFEGQLSQGVARFFGPLSYKSGWKSSFEHKRIANNFDYHVESYWQGQGLVLGPKTGRGVMIEGRHLWSKEKTSCLANSVIDLSMSKSLAKVLGLEKEGDTLKLLLPGVLQGSLPARLESFSHFGLQELDARRILLDDQSFRCYVQQSQKRLMQRPGDYIGMRFYPDVDPMNSPALASVASNIEEVVRMHMRNSQPEVKSWRQQRENFFRGLGFDRAVLSVVLSFLTLAASLNVAAALFVIFFERDKDMMTLRALGMSRGQMLKWILIQGFLIGIFGTALGFVGALGASYLFENWKLIELPAEIYNIDHLVFTFQWQEQLGVCLFGIFCALGVSWAVAHLLTRMKIVEVLSHRR
jgi:ABC-type lipoprotein release transport system permease subunit